MSKIYEYVSRGWGFLPNYFQHLGSMPSSFKTTLIFARTP
jgi:hypothetical protein